MSCFHKEQKEKAYKSYITDALKIITENTSKNEKKYITIRYMDIVEPVKEETRTANEVIHDLKEKLSRL